MPFGSVFATLFFGVVCGTIGLRWLVTGPATARLAGVLLAVLGASLAWGLLARRAWARWVGATVAVMLGVLAVRLVAARGDVGEHLLALASIVTLVLLVVPATGEPRRAEAPGRPARRLGAAGWIAVASGAGLVAIGLGSDVEAPARGTSDASTLPAAAIGRSVRWSDFGPGLARARAENRVVLATFVTDWCPYCTKMTRHTWRASAVATRLGELVPVKVDVEEADATPGPSGPELAQRYQVQGFPVQLLLDPTGAVIARHDGYQGPSELLAWLDDALGGATLSGASR
jgi:thiol:disulfide interchange protein